MNPYQKDIKILANIKKNVDKKNWKCLHSNCDKSAINSHLLQKNGILDRLSEDGHIYEFKGNDYFKTDSDGYFDIKKISINKALSLNLFCTEHDNTIFSQIEKKPSYDIEDKIANTLFSYRTCCSELRKKEWDLEMFTRAGNAKSLSNKKFKIFAEQYLKGINLAISDLQFFKQQFEDELNNNINKFEFVVYNYPIIEVSASGVFNILDTEIMPLGYYVDKKEPLNNLFVNLFPKKDKVIIIFGYHTDFIDDWIRNYIKSWDNLDKIELEKKITELFTTRLESWVISPKLYRLLDKKNINKLIDYWNTNQMNYSSDQTINFNLFE